MIAFVILKIQYKGSGEIFFIGAHITRGMAGVSPLPTKFMLKSVPLSNLRKLRGTATYSY